MIYFIVNFISSDNLNKLNTYLNNFQEVDTGEKKFWVMDVPQNILDIFCNKIQLIEGNKPEVLLSMFRISDSKRDVDWRIHCDGIINNDIPNRAAIFYISESSYNQLHGTAFWQHKKYGEFLNNDKLENFNKLILEDANNLDVWNLKSVIGYKQNRLLSYPANYFHSKYPNKSWESGRKILVIFYK